MQTIAVLLLTLIVASAVWVSADAAAIARRQREVAGRSLIHPGPWAVLVLGLWPVGFPLYLARRSELLRLTDADMRRSAARR